MATGQDLFDKYNAKYFRGRLPRYRVRFVDFSLGRLGWRGECFPERRLIWIRKQLPKGTNVDEVLLHEMCHIRGGTGHGPGFQRNLRRLAAQGVEWAAKEAAECERGPTWNQQMRELRQRLDEIANVQRPRPAFRALTRPLASEMHIPVSEFLRVVPWFRAAWKTACREADSDMATRRAQRSLARWAATFERVGDEEWRCRVCGGTVRSMDEAGRDHIINHGWRRETPRDG